MNLWEIFSLTLLKLATGTWLVTLLLWSSEIRRSFYVFNAAMSATLVTLALLAKWLALGQTDALTMTALTVFIVSSVAASAFHRMERHTPARLLGAMAALCGSALLLMQGRYVAMESSAQWAIGAGFLAGGILLGLVHATMLLGHWYLVMHQLSFAHLQRYTAALLSATVLRLLICLALLWLVPRLDPMAGAQRVSELLNRDLPFFAMRLGGGIVLPAVLGVMSYRCVQLRANQAATGLLYLAEVVVLFGEIFASYLLI